MPACLPASLPCPHISMHCRSVTGGCMCGVPDILKNAQTVCNGEANCKIEAGFGYPAIPEACPSEAPCTHACPTATDP